MTPNLCCRAPLSRHTSGGVGSHLGRRDLQGWGGRRVTPSQVAGFALRSGLTVTGSTLNT